MNKWKLATGTLLAALAYNSYVSVVDERRHKTLKQKHAELVDDFEMILRERNEAAGLSSLYAQKLNEHGVPMDDFTRVIMHGLTKD